MAESRIAQIKLLLKNKHGKLLDIGCAYGPFLKAAKDAGLSPLGIDPAEDAVRYVNEKAGIPAIHGFFPDVCRENNIGTYDAITMWYVIEHFKDVALVLKTVNSLLEKGGVFAFATPSSSGISAKRSIKRFLEKSPADHWTVWKPSRVRKLLLQYGFRVRKVLIKGHHPERCLGSCITKNLIAPEKIPRIIFKLLIVVSKIFKLGDTFEVYAEKIYDVKL
jgi:2-polyprenyl-3-methyl-5-hydroxy-6-metoxy-1,4-benzoquinol methylase